MHPLVMCRKLMNALFSSLSIENTSRSVIDELTTSLRVLNPSISWYLFLISSACSNSRFIAFSFISAISFSCRIFISPFRIELTSSIYFKYSSLEICAMHGAQQFFIWYSRQALYLPFLTPSGVMLRLHVLSGYSSFISPSSACSAPALVYGP